MTSRTSRTPCGAAERDRAAHALALALLERHGVLTREAVASRGHRRRVQRGVYPVLRALEEAGRVRRGYFVDGLGAAQFALPGAIDRLRSVRDSADEAERARVHLLAAADPANPYGAALGWPRARRRRPARVRSGAAGAYVVLVDGVAALYVERGGTVAGDVPGRRRARRSPGSPCAALGGARRRRPLPRAARRQGRRAAGRRVAVAAGPPRGGLRAGLPRARAARSR